MFIFISTFVPIGENMDTAKYEQIKNKYGKDASWAIWDSDGEHKGYERHKHLDDCEGIKDRIRTDVILVGLNQACPDDIKIPFNNFHISKNDIIIRPVEGVINKIGLVMDPTTVNNTYKLAYAFKDTKYEGAYMTDIIKYETVNGKVNNPANSAEVMAFINNNPEIRDENIRKFKEELEFIGSKDPFIIAFGGNVNEILSKYFTVCQVPHYSYTGYGSKEKYKEAVKEAIDSYLASRGNEVSSAKVANHKEFKHPIEDVVAPIVKRFRELAPNKNEVFKLGEAKYDYIHILCNDYIIGCFIKNGREFAFQEKHPRGRANQNNKVISVPIDQLTDEDIISAIVDTPRKRKYGLK